MGMALSLCMAAARVRKSSWALSRMYLYAFLSSSLSAASNLGSGQWEPVRSERVRVVGTGARKTDLLRTCGCAHLGGQPRLGVLAAFFHSYDRESEWTQRGGRTL